MTRLLLHGAVAAVVVVFALLGLWQLDRHGERQAYNELVAERVALPVQPLAAVLGQGERAAAYRRATTTGVYRTSEELLLTGRARDEQPGHHVLTPLEGPDGVVLVDRGWVPFALDTPPVPEAEPPAEVVTVSGVLLPGEPPAPFTRAGGERAPRMTRVDLDRIDTQVTGALAPLWLRLDEQRPPQPGALPAPAALPPLEAGNHLAYAGQWFLFALVALVGYPLLLRRQRLDPGGPVRAVIPRL